MSNKIWTYLELEELASQRLSSYGDRVKLAGISTLRECHSEEFSCEEITVDRAEAPWISSLLTGVDAFE